MPFRDLSLGVLVAAIWGVNFSIIKLGLLTIDPFILAGLRFSLVAIPLVFFIKRPNIPLYVLAIYGLLFGFGLWGVVNLSIYVGMSAGLASLLLQFTAFITVVFGRIYFKESLSKNQYLGMLVSILGLLYIVSSSDGNTPLLSIVLIFSAAFAWAFSNVIIKKYKPANMFSFVVWACLFSPIPLFIMTFILKGADPFVTALNTNYVGVFSILFQSYITTLFGYYIWNSLLVKHPVSLVAPLSLLVPIFGLLGSYLIFEEVVNIEKIIAFLVVMFGLVIFMFKKVKRGE
ncbi:hypothetical protein MS2017_1705 [Bathymodiolus thermophilus thioautotrophic gill symbiont]|uniref:EamA domain-containing protein n=1 Tax=Bathymodiolus thermophilus thioautotrophic gill symbiont TaxID=2360 RepID=A0A3G3INW0_9GAMM|nr:EamA family transporter [Bathymodiolus thermophilus thioautotrophic gill symbiont]AYQ57379.1 hypothetical protein MS2017_1705 [Bathymodiolus thermophilus thioautotrophic gill symbiont]